MLEEVLQSFWSPAFWLPPNTTWADIEPGPDKAVKFTDYRHLLYPLPLGIVLLFLRFVVEKYWLEPIGRSLGIKGHRSKKAAPNPKLEIAYSENNKLNHKTVLGLVKQCDMTERQIERWWRHRRAQDKPSTLTKFCENSWRCIFYASNFIYGVILLWDKPFLWDFKSLWYGYPNQSIENEIWWYYMISMAFYVSLSISQFFDIRRKDFWQMFVHHVLTLLLMSFSWVCNLHRAGSLVIIIHDSADIFLEAAKITKYANYQKTCDTIFAVFTLVWIVTRLGVYPRFIYSSTIEAPRILPMFPAYYFFNSLLVILLFLHIAWTYLILRIAYNAVRAGQMEGDIRSDSSDISDSSENAQQETKPANGTPNKHPKRSSASPRSKSS